MEIDEYLFQKAYKKLKSSIYYDKTNLILRDKLVRFEHQHKYKNEKEYNKKSGQFEQQHKYENENECNKNLDKYLDDWRGYFETYDDDDWKDFIDEHILSKIDCHFFPKTLEPQDGREIITNFEDHDVIQVDEVQSFIDLAIEGHILGVVWLLLIGYKLDKNLSHCYGNRIRSTLYNNFSKRITFSPELFEPYFVKYESWRDNALQIAEERVEHGEDILIFTLDFTRFYYSIDISEEFMETLLQPILEDISDEKEKQLLKRINNFVFQVIRHYAEKYNKYCSDKSHNKRNLLPIGFLPSNVLANCVLKKFDEAIINHWNPLYFGRYVDDILIVDKISNTHPLYTTIKSGNASIDEVISYYLIKEKSLVTEEQPHSLCPNGDNSSNDDSKDHSYRLSKEYTDHLGANCDIRVKKEKCKVFYFASGNSTALLKCFRENISRNKSEFRYMPEDEVIFQKDDYSEIYELSQHGINKFRDVKGIQLDKFKFSKYLAKYKRIAGLVNEEMETTFEKDIIQILNKRVIIENYTAWEKIISILYIHKKFEILNKVIEKIIKAIDSVTFNSVGKYDPKSVSPNIKVNLKEFLFSGIARTYAFDGDGQNFKSISNKYNIDRNLPYQYLMARMSDKSMQPIWLELFLKGYNLKKDKSFKIDDCYNLDEIFEIIHEVPEDWWKNEGINNEETNNEEMIAYKYYPYFISMYDLLISYQYFCMANDIDFVEKEGGYNTIKNLYINKNFDPYNSDKELHFPVSVKTFKEDDAVSSTLLGQRAIAVEGEPYSKFKIAVSNIKMDHENVTQQMTGFFDRSYKRYQKISYIVNTAVEQGVHLLVMPECCVPIEWLEILSRTCAKNDLALVTGIEHVIARDKVYNLVAIILPFQKDDFKSAYISFHSKNYFAPAEEEMIRGYGLAAMNHSTVGLDKEDKSQGKYELYKWHDLYFSVYCCFELTSITDRAIFQSYADAIIAIEWNKDVNYYSNILESLSRDLHCYCIQVNSSDFGDSRLTQPTKKETQNILRVTGGEEPVILVGTIDIAALRDFQLKRFSLQQHDPRFKPTPPQLDRTIIHKKVHKEDFLF